MSLFLNEIDPGAAMWLRGLMSNELIPNGVVDERSILHVRPDDLRDHRRAHFFAGIGGWELALRLAGWPADRPVWTGSCPCQPYSSAGKGEGDKDPRNLWPEFFRLIRECRPDVVFGEQVASGDVVGTELETAFVAAVQRGNNRRANQLAQRIAKRHAREPLEELAPRWVDRVRTDLEGEGYTFGFEVLGAHSAGAPHIRQRLYWVAHLPSEGQQAGVAKPQAAVSNGVALGDAGPSGLPGTEPEDLRGAGRRDEGRAVTEPGASFWTGSRFVRCRDGKARRVPLEPGLFPLAHGFSGRVAVERPEGLGATAIEEEATRWANRVCALRGAGNAICIWSAVAFIEAFLEAEHEHS